MAFHLAVNDTESEIWREYPEGIRFDKPYEVALKSFVTYNNIFNVTTANNKLIFVYQDESNTAPDETEIPFGSTTDDEDYAIHLLDSKEPVQEKPKKGKKKKHEKGFEIPRHYYAYEPLDRDTFNERHQNLDRKTIRETVFFPPGIYEIADLNKYLQSRLPQGKNFCILLNKNVLKVEMGGNIAVDLCDRNSIAPLLGFDRKVYPQSGHYYSTWRVDIFPVNMIRIKANIVKSNIVDTKRYDNTIYEFPLTVNPGEKIVERPAAMTIYTVNIDTIHELHLKIVDQDNNLVNFQGEKINIVLEFRPTG